MVILQEEILNAAGLMNEYSSGRMLIAVKYISESYAGVNILFVLYCFVQVRVYDEFKGKHPSKSVISGPLIAVEGMLDRGSGQ